MYIIHIVEGQIEKVTGKTIMPNKSEYGRSWIVVGGETEDDAADIARDYYKRQIRPDDLLVGAIKGDRDGVGTLVVTAGIHAENTPTSPRCFYRSGHTDDYALDSSRYDVPLSRRDFLHEFVPLEIEVDVG